MTAYQVAGDTVLGRLGFLWRQRLSTESSRGTDSTSSRADRASRDEKSGMSIGRAALGL